MESLLEIYSVIGGIVGIVSVVIFYSIVIWFVGKALYDGLKANTVKIYLAARKAILAIDAEVKKEIKA